MREVSNYQAVLKHAVLYRPLRQAKKSSFEMQVSEAKGLIPKVQNGKLKSIYAKNEYRAVKYAQEQYTTSEREKYGFRVLISVSREQATIVHSSRMKLKL